MTRAATATGRRGGPAADGRGVLVAVPTYNERQNLADLVVRLHATLPHARVLVVDDGSPDGTGELADALADADPRVAVRHHAPRAGLGAAYVDAFLHVVAGYDTDDVGWVVQMDADGSHAPEELPRLLAAGADADLVVGSRYVPGGRIVDWSAHRRRLSEAGNAYSRWALRLPVHDVTGGFRLFRRSVLEEVGLSTVSSQGYCFQVDLLFRVWRAGFRVREVPITFAERARGESKIERRRGARGPVAGDRLGRPRPLASRPPRLSPGGGGGSDPWWRVDFPARPNWRRCCARRRSSATAPRARLSRATSIHDLREIARRRTPRRGLRLHRRRRRGRAEPRSRPRGVERGRVHPLGAARRVGDRHVAGRSSGRARRSRSPWGRPGSRA